MTSKQRGIRGQASRSRLSRRGFLLALGVLSSGCLHDDSDEKSLNLYFGIKRVPEEEIPRLDQNYTYTLEHEKLRYSEDLEKALQEKHNGTYEEGSRGVYNYTDAENITEATKNPEGGQPYFYVRYRNETYKVVTSAGPFIQRVR